MDDACKIYISGAFNTQHAVVIDRFMVEAIVFCP